MHDIPIIDISGVTRRGGQHSIVREVEDACHEIGFMYVRGHGIAAELISRMRQAVIRYFERPLDEKLRDCITPDNYRGYIPTGFFSPNSGGGQTDNYEGYKLHFEVQAANDICRACDLYGPNKWPDELPGFKQTVLEYWRSCDDVTQVLLRILATILGADGSDFLRHFEMPLTNMTLLHYPPQDADASGFGIHPHKDTDALTILVPDKVGGLMVKQRGRDDWYEVDAPVDSLVVNIGDLLELWSGGYFVSTPHKVVNKSGAERYSFPYFVVPRFDTVVEPLRPAQRGFKRASVHVGDVSREVWRTNWPDTSPSNPTFDLGTLTD
jgi:isopenicillin N synthase-like dioxygenase